MPTHRLPARPHVVVNCAMSLDGYLDDAGPRRLILSNDEDLDRVDALRAGSDAILVGAGTVRRDNPRLLVRSSERRRDRQAAGRPQTPMKVTVTAGGDLDAGSAFFSAGPAETLVYTPTSRVDAVRTRLGHLTVVADGGEPCSPAAMLADLHGRGIGTLLVEGGTTILTTLLAAGLVDELYVAVAPFFVGDASAPRLVHPAEFPQRPEQPMQLVGAYPIGNVALLHYRLRGELA